ncbi:hypothetical protein GGI03_005185 [Coemansia sp. RSA 2337]|nr:hypothetical protein H4S03_008708 [Coemansia sp. S3946]KAJ2059424.1 hypothetical protein GGH13_006953 [Coemansia sp. S155-1]KAJ2108736.1 hypothetical protein IW146_006696 [Coemansia sp. RSA 922]KAJ2460834.1 hypothetical protein GGI03_005185 [Coemansia sp. RSA 2337]
MSLFSSCAVDKLRVGWIGLGAMGGEMARNLQAHRTALGLSPISVYNRTASKCDAVTKLGAQACGSASDVANASDVVFLSLFDGDAVKSVVAEILGNSATGMQPLLIADLTTVHPDSTQWVLDELDRRRRECALPRPVEFSQTPVWGAPPAARAARLVFVSSGASRSVLESLAVPAFARAAIDCGDDVVRAAKFKILGNFMIASTVETLGEAMAVAEETGIGRELYLEFVKEMFPIPPAVGYATKMTEERGEASKTNVGFTVRGGIKDVGYAIDLAKSVGMRLPIAELALEHLQWVNDKGDPNWDWSSLAFALRKK